jgi:hypothetical protein
MNAEAISGQLAGRIRRLAVDLLPEGHREGQEWRVGSVWGEPGDSLGVHLAGAKAGVWADFATGEGGDPLDVVCAVHRFKLGEALAWSRRWLGMDDDETTRPPRPVPRRTPESRGDDHWRRIWRESGPIVGTIVETYFASRRLPITPAIDEVIRFDPGCPFKGERLPAMVALLRDVRSDEPCGIHRTALLADGSDRDRERGRAMLGRFAGAVIKLCPDDEVTLGLGLVEGIETGLRLIGIGWRPIWAAGSAANIAKFPTFAGIDELTIFADRDGNEVGQRAARECARRWSEAGRPVAVRAPSRIGADWGDV